MTPAAEPLKGITSLEFIATDESENIVLRTAAQS